MQPNNNDLIRAYNDAVQRLIDLLYIMNFYCSPLFVRIAIDDFWTILARYDCRNHLHVYGDDEWRRSQLNEVLLWCWLVEQDAEEYLRYLCYASDATGHNPGNICGYQVYDENLMAEVPPALRAIDNGTALPIGDALVLVHGGNGDSVRPDYTTYTLPESTTAQGHFFDSTPRVAHDVCYT